MSRFAAGASLAEAVVDAKVRVPSVVQRDKQ
jgi:hypothetical protein